MKRHLQQKKKKEKKRFTNVHRKKKQQIFQNRAIRLAYMCKCQ